MNDEFVAGTLAMLRNSAMPEPVFFGGFTGCKLRHYVRGGLDRDMSLSDISPRLVTAALRDQKPDVAVLLMQGIDAPMYDGLAIEHTSNPEHADDIVALFADHESVVSYVAPVHRALNGDVLAGAFTGPNPVRGRYPLALARGMDLADAEDYGELA